MDLSKDRIIPLIIEQLEKTKDMDLLDLIFQLLQKHSAQN